MKVFLVEIKDVTPTYRYSIVCRQKIKNSRTTFPKQFYPRIDLAPFFWPPEFVFTCLIGLLRRLPWPPLAISPLQTGLPRTSEMIARTGIFGSFLHVIFKKIVTHTSFKTLPVTQLQTECTLLAF